ncbi:hypothetical protein ACFL03_04575 [Thermodesulfobacteriota bacterium]
MMLEENTGKSYKLSGIIITLAIILALGVAGFMLWQQRTKKPVADETPEKTRVQAKPQPVIDYGKLEKDKDLKALMQKRKAEYGVEKGIDIIVKSDESLKVGDTTVPMQEIMDKMRLKSGEIVERYIESGHSDPNKQISVFGIYVVQPGDNIWNIHFQFLKDYFVRKGATLSPSADEPDRYGYSSGVGKLLKFSETMIYIYNLKDRKIDADLNLILPLTKIVIYNMDQIFSLLDQIDYEHVNRIHFDGETIWIPAEQ